MCVCASLPVPMHVGVCVCMRAYISSCALANVCTHVCVPLYFFLNAVIKASPSSLKHMLVCFFQNDDVKIFKWNGLNTVFSANMKSSEPFKETKQSKQGLFSTNIITLCNLKVKASDSGIK